MALSRLCHASTCRSRHLVCALASYLQHRDADEGLFGIILVAFFLLSLGPYLVVLDRKTSLPLPYLLLYYVVPGFDALRVPARFGLMAVLAASVLAALGFLQACNFLNARLGFGKRGTSMYQVCLALACLGVFTLELGFKPLPPLRI